MRSDWRSMPFSDAVVVNPRIRLERGKAYPFISMAAVEPNSQWAYADQKRDYSSGGSRFRHGDTLMARITPCLENGKVARYRSTDETDVAFGSTEFIVIRGRSEVTDNRFAYYLTQSPKVRNYAISQMTGTSGRQRVLTSALDHINVSLPPLADQRHIAHILGTLDDKIELNRRMNATLEGMARALFKSWFVDFEPVRAKMDGRWRRGESLPGMPAELYDLFPERLAPSELGEAPEGWGVKALGEVVELAYGKSLRADKRLAGRIPVYGSNGQVGWHNEKLVAGPGVIVGRKGNPGVVDWSHTDFYPIDTTFYVKPRAEEMSLYFLLYALQGQNLPSVAADSAVPGLNRNLAYMNEQLIPNTGIVAAFDQQVEALFAKMQCLEEQIRTLAGLRDALLPRLVSGDMRDVGISPKFLMAWNDLQPIQEIRR